MDKSAFSFSRPELAQAYCDSLIGAGLLDSRSGLFLAAPRRTGKSTFLRQDLLPAAEARGWTSVYVDLWSDKSIDPSILIANAISAKISQFDGMIAKLAKSSGLEKINLFGAFTLNAGALSLPKGATLADALEVLSVAAGTQILLVIDEAQHALVSDEGVNAMFALKAARDRLNQGAGGQRLCLVFTGSNRDKLAQLTVKRDQPFFGCSVTPFPLLDRAFCDAYTAFVNKRLAGGNQFSANAVFDAFCLVGRRPELLQRIVGEIAFGAGAGELEEQLKYGAANLRRRVWSEMESEFATLTEIQRVVLETIIRDRELFVPFSEASMQHYATALGQDKVSTGSVQAALDALREKNLVWRSSFGVYALEDESMAHWFNQR